MECSCRIKFGSVRNSLEFPSFDSWPFCCFSERGDDNGVANTGWASRPAECADMDEVFDSVCRCKAEALVFVPLSYFCLVRNRHGTKML